MGYWHTVLQSMSNCPSQWGKEHGLIYSDVINQCYVHNEEMFWEIQKSTKKSSIC